MPMVSIPTTVIPSVPARDLGLVTRVPFPRSLGMTALWVPTLQLPLAPARLRRGAPTYFPPFVTPLMYSTSSFLYGVPSARIVLLKDFDARGFTFYTNYDSRKGDELEVHAGEDVRRVFDVPIGDRQDPDLHRSQPERERSSEMLDQDRDEPLERAAHGPVDDHGAVLGVVLAGAAELVMGKAEGICAAIVRGAEITFARGAATELVRPASEDLFR